MYSSGRKYAKKVKVKVKPNSKQRKIEEIPDGNLNVYLNSPPVDGKANKEVIQLLAEKFDIPKSLITIKGDRQPYKGITRCAEPA